MTDFVANYEKRMESKKKQTTKARKGLEKFIDEDKKEEKE
jgi:hypothetical protein